MGLQILRFVLPPSIAITAPQDAVSNLSAGVLSYELKGTADAHASIVIATSAGAQLTTKADENGLWSLIVPLGTGRTEVVANAVKPGTGGESSTSAERVFVVAIPDKVAPEITVTQPSANLAVKDGEVPISLVTAPNSDVEVTATDTAGSLITAALRSDGVGLATHDSATLTATLRNLVSRTNLNDGVNLFGDGSSTLTFRNGLDHEVRAVADVGHRAQEDRGIDHRGRVGESSGKEHQAERSGVQSQCQQQHEQKCKTKTAHIHFSPVTITNIPGEHKS